MDSSKQLSPLVLADGNPIAALRDIVMHEVEMAVRWGDMDAYNHVNNTVYFRFMEQCRLEWFAKLGFKTVDEDVVPILVEANCRFIRAVTYPATVRVTIRVTVVGPKIVETIHDIFVGNVLYATGICKLLWMSRSANKAVALPEAVRARLLLLP
ncbi:MAG: thioesterase family protein [Casimicrobium sp.]|jgi:acyl-CoA thioester hydrolase